MGRREEKVNVETVRCARFEVFEGDKEREACSAICAHDSMCVGGVCMYIQMTMCVFMVEVRYFPGYGLLSICLFVAFF